MRRAIWHNDRNGIGKDALYAGLVLRMVLILRIVRQASKGVERVVEEPQLLMNRNVLRFSFCF